MKTLSLHAAMHGVRGAQLGGEHGHAQHAGAVPVLVLRHHLPGTVQYSKYSTVQCNAVHTVQYSAVQYTSYQVQYDPANIVTYVGKEQTIISFDFEAEVGLLVLTSANYSAN